MTLRLKKIICVVLCISFMLSSVNALTERQVKWFEKMENEFLGKGIGIDQDFTWGYQCVDLVSNYANFIFPDAMGSPSAYKSTLNIGNARELYWNSSNEYFKKIPYEDGMIPKTGDIIVWGMGSDYNGHVAVCYYADETNIILIHQDGYIRPVVFRQDADHSILDHYNGSVIGFLRPKAEKIVERNPLMNRHLYNVKMDSDRNISFILDDYEYNSLVEIGIISPSQNTSPLDKLNRLQAVALILKMTGKNEAVNQISEEEFNDAIDKIEDIDDVPNWGRKYLAYAINNGIISGVSQTEEGKITFDPNGSVGGSAFLVVSFRSLGYKVGSIQEANNMYSNMISFDPTQNVDSEQDDATNNTNIALINKMAIDRNEAAKMMFDFLHYASFVDESGNKTISLREVLVESNLANEESLKKLFGK